MIVSKTTLLKWNNANKKRYVDLGYRFTQCGDEFEVDINDLSKSVQTNFITKLKIVNSRFINC